MELIEKIKDISIDEDPIISKHHKMLDLVKVNEEICEKALAWKNERILIVDDEEFC